MVWIIALLCISLVGMAGYYRGPICAGFSLVGLLAGIILARPLSPLTRFLLPLLGFHHPIWQLFVPGALVMLVVLIIFKIVGNTLHQKMTLHYKYQSDERIFFRWERLYKPLGFCVGTVNGVIYFFIVMLAVYVTGYFTTVVGPDDLSSGAKMISSLRAQLHESGLDRVVAAYDPTPPMIYQATEIADLVRHNPLLVARLSHYPPLLTFCQQPQIRELTSDLGFQQMVQTHANITNILLYPKFQAVATNADVAGQLHGLLGDDLTDLQQFLLTGKSPKYDPQKLLGIWDIDVHASLAEERRLHMDMTRPQIVALRSSFVPLISGLSLIATTDNQLVLKKLNPNSAQPMPVGDGSWKQTDNTYEVTLAGNKPDTVQVAPGDDGTLQLPRNGHILVFNKEM